MTRWRKVRRPARDGFKGPVCRAQTILFHLHRLKASRRIPDLPVFLDSPMAVDASEIFCGHLSEYRLTAEQCRAARGVATYVRHAEDFKALNANAMPKIIISASGMAARIVTCNTIPHVSNGKDISKTLADGVKVMSVHDLFNR